MEKEEINEVTSAVKEALEYIGNEKYSQAMVVLRLFIDDIEKNAVRESEKSSFFSFSSGFEAMLFTKLYMPKKMIKNTPYEYHTIYRLYGYTLYKLGRIYEAVEALEKAVSWNPVNMKTLIMLCDVYEINRNFEKLSLLASDGLKTAYHNNYIAKFYMYKGICAENNNDLETAVMLYDTSFAYENTAEAVKRLKDISVKTGKKLKKYQPEKIMENFSRKGIQFGVNPVILEFVYELGEASRKQKDIKLAEYCFNLYFNLTADKQIQAKLTEIKLLKSGKK
jgi:tetratricopeptide (TPR) repeat protein